MTERKPLVLSEGEVAQLPEGDKLPGATYLFATKAELDAVEDTLPLNARVSKLWEYPDDITNALVVPDYASRETENRAAVGNAWTVEATGFLFLSLYVGGSSNSGAFSINGIEVLSVHYSATGGTNTAIVPVSAGDIVTWVGDVFTRECYYIPPKLIIKQLPIIIDRNGSYSTEQVKTVDSWLDGRPVYKRTFTGFASNYTAPFRLAIPVGTVAGIRDLVRVEGYFHDGDSLVALPCFDPGEPGEEALGASVTLVDETIVLTLKNTQLTLEEYALTVFYTLTI